MNRRTKSQIPVGTQFSPNLISLPSFVQMAIRNSGNIEALREAVIRPPVRIKAYNNPPTRRMKGLPLEASVQYGLLSENSYVATGSNLQASSPRRTGHLRSFCAPHSSQSWWFARR